MANWRVLDAIQIETEKMDLELELPEIVDHMATNHLKRLTFFDTDGRVCGHISSENPFNELRNRLTIYGRLCGRQLAREKRQQSLLDYSDPLNESIRTHLSINLMNSSI